MIAAVFFKERPHTYMTEASPTQLRREAPRAAAPAAESAADEYAATGMGRRTDHAVTRVWLDLENTPAQTINIRYEFRDQLVSLGILPRTPVMDPLQRREGARGFEPWGGEPGFSPEPPARLKKR